MGAHVKRNSVLVSGIFQILVGTGMLGIWMSLLLRREIPELQTEVLRIAAHLLAEASTSVMLLYSGFHILLKGRKKRGLFNISMGALLYTLITSPAYYAQAGEWVAVSLFLVLLTITLLILLFD